MFGAVWEMTWAVFTVDLRKLFNSNTTSHFKLCTNIARTLQLIFRIKIFPNLHF